MNTFFTKRQNALKLLATAYVVLLLLSHWQLPSALVWYIAAFFSIAMNFTYLTEALSVRRFVGAESLVASVLIVASVLGILISPLFVILAIFAHGCWDLAKHFGSGVPFFYWYTCSCFLVDTVYSASLLFYWLGSA